MWNVFKVNNKKKQNNVNDVFLVFLLLIWTYFTPFSSASIADFEQENITWVVSPWSEVVKSKSRGTVMVHFSNFSIESDTFFNKIDSICIYVLKTQ